MLDVQDLIDRMHRGEVPIDELHRLTAHPAALVLVNAIEMLGQKANGDPQILDDLRNAAMAEINQVCLMGTIRIAHVAIACLLRIGSERALTIANDLISSRPEPERSDLMRYLQSEGLALIGIK
jgi:hypothetical protein